MPHLWIKVIQLANGLFYLAHVDEGRDSTAGGDGAFVMIGQVGLLGKPRGSLRVAFCDEIVQEDPVNVTAAC